MQACNPMALEWGPCVCGSTPVANAGGDRDVSYQVAVHLDGTLSYAPAGTPLQYQWELTLVPAGSVAMLVDPTTPMPAFVPDLPGTYGVRLTVSDGAQWSAPDILTITAHNDSPVASAGQNRNTVTGTLVSLDGSGSSDANGDTLTFSWSITARPPGSNAALSDASVATPTLTPDVDGSYTMRLVVSDGRAASPPASVNVASFRRINRLAYRVVDAEYSRALDRIVMVAATPASGLHLYDPATNGDTVIALPTTPTAVSVGPTGLLAAVGHNG